MNIGDNATVTNSSGTVNMRIANGQVSDRLQLDINKTATLGGTLNAAGSGLNANQTWTIVSAGVIAGGFATVNRPR